MFGMTPVKAPDKKNKSINLSQISMESMCKFIYI